MLAALRYSFSKTIRHNAFNVRKLQNVLKMKQNRTKEEVCLWKALLRLILTYRDSPSQLRADAMDQCFKHYWQLIRWYMEVMLLTLPSSYIYIQTHEMSLWSCSFKKLGYSLPEWQMTANRFYTKLYWARNASKFSQKRKTS